MKNPLRPKVAFVLGGGGARGLAHLGVLKVLESAGVRPDLIVGCSAGALVGSLYAFSATTEEAEARLLAFVADSPKDMERYDAIRSITPLKPLPEGFFGRLWRLAKMGKFFATTLFKESFIDPKQFDRNVAALLPDRLIEESPVPLAIVATDLDTCREVVLTSGPLRRAVKASSAIAGVFPPVQVNEAHFVDGGFTSKVPVEVALRMGADVVLAVDVSSDLPEEDVGDLRRGTNISSRATAIMAETLKNLQLRFADVVIKPKMEDVHWADFAGVSGIIPLGEAAALEALPAVKRAIRRGMVRRAARILGLSPKRKVVFPSA